MSRVLGKGLSALIPEKKETENQGVAYLKVEKIHNNTQQPRLHYGQAKLDELKASIKEKGILQPILVRETPQGYEVVAGERRLRAARELGLQEIPVIIKSFSDQEALVVALVENIQREELTPIEEAEAYRKLIEEFQYTHDTVAGSVGKDRSTVTNILRLLRLPEDIRGFISEGNISVGHARALLAVDNETIQQDLAKQIMTKGLSVRSLEDLVKKRIEQDSSRPKKSDELDPQITTLQAGLEKLLGTKVKIQGNPKKGKIVVDYYSQEELTRIVKAIIK